MKIKQQPEDFHVEERTDSVAATGPFAFYRLEKRSWTTTDALALVRRKWHIDPRRLSYGGLKDRHAHTIQYFTIFRGPQRGFTQERVRVGYLGQVADPYTSEAIRANRFRLVLRDLTDGEAAAWKPTLEQVRTSGVPNYFDDQRFGSVNSEGTFIGRLLVEGKFEEALLVALAEPYEFDDSEAKREKSLLRRHWGDWGTLRKSLPRGHARSLIEYLAIRPDDFRGAVAQLRPELRGLYLSAYQSHLWNRILARWIETTFPPEQILQTGMKLGEFPMWRCLHEEQKQVASQLLLPLPSARLRLEENDPLAPLIQDTLAQEGTTLRDLKIQGIRELFFSKGLRAALSLPSHLRGQTEPDERHSGRLKGRLSFELPRGAYATLLIKRLQAAGAAQENLS